MGLGGISLNSMKTARINIFFMLKGARSRYFRYFYLILLILSSKRQIGNPNGVFHLQNHGHITTESDFPAEKMTF